MYATPADIEAIYGAAHLATLVPEGLDITTSAARALADAAGEIDLYLANRYSLPVSSVPVGLRNLAVDLGCYRLAITHDTMTEAIEKRAKAARDLLVLIAAGKASLGLSDTVPGSSDPDAAASGDGAYFRAAPRLFGRGSP